jgi:hypothetical protein
MATVIRTNTISSPEAQESHATTSGSASRTSNVAAAPDRDERKSHALGDLSSHYGTLAANDPVHKFVESRLSALLAGIPIAERPHVHVLGRQGYGINAGATEDGYIFVSPELLTFLKSVEELDFVLLHEVIHLAHGHHAAQRRLGDSLLPHLGIQRVQEYDADIHAFILLAQPGRYSSPIGAINCLERFRDHCPNGWDVAHGNLTDRIMNLKMFSLLGDLSSYGAASGDFGSLTKAPRALPAFIARDLSELPKGSRIAALLRNPPSGHRYDEYRQQLSEAILDSGAPSLRRAIPDIVSQIKKFEGTVSELKKSSALAHGSVARVADYTDVLRCTYDRLFSLTATKATELGLNAVEARILLGIEVALAGQAPDDLKRYLSEKAGAIACKAADTLKEAVLSPADLDRVSHIVTLIEGSAPHACTEQIFHAVVPHALRENCAFDDDSSGLVDTRIYLEAVRKFTSALQSITTGIDASDDRLRNEFDAMSAFTLVAHLSDLRSEQLSTLSTELAPNYPLRKQDRGALSSALTSVLRQKHSPEVVRALMDFAREKLEVLSLSETQQALVDILAEVHRIEATERLPEGIDTIEKLCRQAALIASTLPPEIPAFELLRPHGKEDPGSRSRYIVMLHLVSLSKPPETVSEKPFGGSSRLNPLEHLHFADSVRLIKAHLGLLYAVCANNLEREDAISQTERLVRVRSESFEQIASLIDELHSERPEAEILGVSLPPRHFKPAHDLRLHHLASDALLSELTRSPSLSPQERLARIYKFVTVCHVAESEDQRTFEVFQSVLDYGEEALREAFQDDRTSPEFLRHAIAVSFFVSDGVLGRSIQRELLLRLIDSAGSASAADEAFSRLNRQRSHLNLEALERLVEGADRVEDIRAIGTQSREHLFSAINTEAVSGAGKLVLADLAVSKLARWDFRDLLSVGLEAPEDDRRFRDRIADRWWDAAEEYLAPSIEFSPLFAAEDSTFGPKQFAEILQQLDATPPATLGKEASLNLQSATAQGLRQGLYSLGLGERLFILRKLTSDPTRGVLISAERRERVAEMLLGKLMESSENDSLATLSSKAFKALFRSVEGDDLSLALTPMLLDRFLRAPASPSGWREVGEDKAFDFLEERGWGILKASEQDERSMLHQSVANHFEWAFSGTDPRTKKPSVAALDRFVELCNIDLSPKAVAHRADAISFILDFSRNLQTPGTRALQLLGGIVQLPKEIENEFLQVYDARKGQSKSSALATIERALPEYAKRLVTMQRIGGGALYSVFLVGLDNGAREVVRVVNPNPEYHTQRIVRSMRAAQEQLAREDSRFDIGEQVINLVDEWISAELKDETHEKDDAAFRKRWNGWKPASRCPLSIYVPETFPSGTLVARREEFIPGRNFTELGALAEKDSKLAKQVVALAAQHYAAQLSGSLSENLFGSELLVHSDISPGNLRMMDGGKVAILDRSMFLKFSRDDRILLDTVTKAKTAKDRAVAIVQGLAALQEQRPSKDRVRAIATNVISALGGETSLEGTMLKGLLAAQREGLKVPLRFQLLVKNLNSLRVMAEKVGFNGLNEALDFKWG